MLVSSKNFTFDKPTKTFIAELSDLPGGLGRVYPDACDVGLTVISERTGAEVTFAVTNAEYDGEGELKWYDLEPTRESVRREPAAAGVKMVLFND